MGILRVTRTKETFRDKISSQTLGSQEGIFVAIDNFEKFSMERFGKVNIIPDMNKGTEIEVIDTLQSWINFMNANHISPSTVTIYFSRVKKYLHYMGIKVNPEDVKMELEFRRIPKEEKYGLTLDDIQKIFVQFPYNTKVQFMCQLSSLMRIGEITQLRKKHLDSSKTNIIVKIPPEIAKFDKGRTTYFSKEASALLRPRLRKLTDDDLIFTKNEIPHNAGVNAEAKLRRALIKCGLTMRTSTTDRYLINTHSFRAYGITKLSRHDQNFAKKLAGQKSYMDQYDRLSDNEKLELYEKYEHELIVDESKRDKARIAQLESDKEIEIDSLKQSILELKNNFKELQNKIKS